MLWNINIIVIIGTNILTTIDYNNNDHHDDPKAHNDHPIRSSYLSSAINDINDNDSTNDAIRPRHLSAASNNNTETNSICSGYIFATHNDKTNNQNSKANRWNQANFL